MLIELLGFDTYDEVKLSHKKWVESGLLNGVNRYDEKWSRSIAVGSKGFIDNVKSLMGGIGPGTKEN